ncbi:MAG: hypothetical protein AB7P20_16495 [Rhizobiaceae bacterium]
MGRLANWLRTWKDEITAAAALLGVVIGVVGFGMTWLQLSRTTETLQASNAYQIQKDARELIENLLAKPEFRKAVGDGITAGNEQAALDNMWRMFNFYLSVYRQSEGGGLAKEFVASYKDDFCGFMKNKGAEEGWTKLKAAGRIGQPQETMRKRWCNA